jgi:hypothetical protein
MCRTFISHLAKENIQIDMFPKSQQVTYRYYLGRYYLFESQVRKVLYERECIMDSVMSLINISYRLNVSWILRSRNVQDMRQKIKGTFNYMASSYGHI